MPPPLSAAGWLWVPVSLGLAEGKKMDIPVTWLFQVQKFEDRLAVHIGRRVEPSDVQDRRRQVDI